MEDLKNIIAVFIKQDAASITDGTLINGIAIPGSILIHRMYAAINKAGYSIKDYSRINTYGELVAIITGSVAVDVNNYQAPVVLTDQGNQGQQIIGIDIEFIDNMPVTNDFREDQFYTDNFSTAEIAYSLLKANPYETFAGLFCAKEALCKADNNLISVPFNRIEIEHTGDGTPTFQNYSLSISHSKDYSIAVAANNFAMPALPVAVADNAQKEIILRETITTKADNKLITVVVIISVCSILLNLLLLYLYLNQKAG